MFTTDNMSREIFRYFTMMLLVAGNSYLKCWLQVVCHPWHELHQSVKTQDQWFRLFQHPAEWSEIFANVKYICTRMWFFPSFSQIRSFFGLTGTTTWWTVSGTESSPFRSTHVGKCMIFSESFFTSNECSVAEQTITYNTYNNLFIKNCSGQLYRKLKSSALITCSLLPSEVTCGIWL